jgi:hypothetical protein
MAAFANSGAYLAFAACMLLLVFIFFIIMLSRRLDRLSLGTSGSLEETVGTLTTHMQEMQKFRIELEQYLKHAESRLRSSVRGVGIVRFNPFSNDGSSGGNQSFAIALLDERHSGVVLSALYSRDRVGVYAKPVDAGKSSFTLSSEESEALEKAVTSLGKPRDAK